MEGLSFNEVKNLIATVGADVTVLVTGSPGMGKTSIHKALMLETKRWGYYCDAPLLDVPDVAMPYVTDGLTYFAPAARWGTTQTTPGIVMVDELAKAPGHIKPVLTRLLCERTVGDDPLPEGTWLFATSNLATDGVGDAFPAHMNNRITTVHMRNPTADEWCSWGAENGIDTSVLTFVNQFPHVFDHYTAADASSNPYIFNPKTNNKAFVSGRSLEKASNILMKRKMLGDNTTHMALAGTIGASAAADLSAFVHLTDSLPSFAVIEEKGDKAPLPATTSAQMLLVFGSVQRVTRENLDAYLAYVKLMPTELQALWASMMCRSKSKGPLFATNQNATGWCLANAWVFA